MAESPLNRTPVMDYRYKLLCQGTFLSFKSRDEWEYVERQNASGCVAILAITESREIILVEQFRVPLQRRVIELPAGLAGDAQSDKQETLIQAAKRELLEETGYEARHMEYLTDGPSSPGLSTEVITFFRAQGLRKVSEGGGEGSENIIVHAVPLERLTFWLDFKQREGCLIDCKIFTALYFELAP